MKTSLYLGASAIVVALVAGIGWSAKPGAERNSTQGVPVAVAKPKAGMETFDFSKLPVSKELPLISRPLQPGDLAPDFKLLDQSGKPHFLSARRGKRTVLSFYPQSDYAMCSQAAVSVDRDLPGFQQRGVEVFGISVQPVETQRDFAARFDLKFPLLADSDKSASRAYGVLSQSGLAGRVTFIVGPDGRIEETNQNVRPATLGNDLLARLDTFGTSALN